MTGESIGMTTLTTGETSLKVGRTAGRISLMDGNSTGMKPLIIGKKIFLMTGRTLEMMICLRTGKNSLTA